MGSQGCESCIPLTAFILPSPLSWLFLWEWLFLDHLIWCPCHVNHVTFLLSTVIWLSFHLNVGKNSPLDLSSPYHSFQLNNVPTYESIWDFYQFTVLTCYSCSLIFVYLHYLFASWCIQKPHHITIFNCDYLALNIGINWKIVFSLVSEPRFVMRKWANTLLTKLKLFGYIMRSQGSLEKTITRRKIEGARKRGRPNMR